MNKFLETRHIGKHCEKCNKTAGFCLTCEKNLCKNCHQFI